MVMQLVVNSLIITSIIIMSLLSGVTSYSACDDIDIHLIIDTDSIIQNHVNIEKFIQSVIWNGTSEYTAISIALYGNNIPYDQNSSIIIGLNDTHSIYQRAKHEQQVLYQLRRTFTSITASKSNEQITISLLDAFQHSNIQQKPARLSKKELKFMPNKEKSIKMDEYFIFDHYNKLVLSDIYNDDICAIMYHDGVINKNVHFIMGQTLTKKSLKKCKNGNLFYDRVGPGTFFVLPDIMNTDNNKLETILDITCPTYINIDKTHEYNAGHLSLSNHVQWIDIIHVKKCNLVKIKQTNNKFLINSTLSFIEINNYNTGDNTYKINDYLLIHKDELEILSKLGCILPVYKIIDIKPDIIGSGVKLYVSIPSLPTEYIDRIKVSGTHPLSGHNNKKRSGLHRRLQQTNGERNVAEEILSIQSPGLLTMQGTYDNINGAITKSGDVANLEVDIFGVGNFVFKADFDYTFNINMDLNYEFEWNLYHPTIYLRYELVFDYMLNASVNIEFESEIDIKIEDILKYENEYAFVVGDGIPVFGTYFIDVDLEMKTTKLDINAGLNCSYGGNYTYGYEYNYTNNYKANFDTIANIELPTTDAIYTWSSVDSAQDCANLNYGYDDLGLTCAYFDYNQNMKVCRCIGIDRGTELTDDENQSGIILYVLDKSCPTNDNSVMNCNTPASACGSGFKVKTGSVCECRRCRTSNPGKSNEESHNRTIKTRELSLYNGCRSTGYDPSDKKTQCPRTEISPELFGFDTYINITIGTDLYYIITVYGKGVIHIPFRIRLPVFDNNICSGSFESCNNPNNPIQAAIQFNTTVAFYSGVDVGFGELKKIIDDNIGKASNELIDPDAFTFPSIGSEVLIDRYEIFPNTTLSCFKLEGSLNVINTFYKGACCDANANDGIVFLDSNVNHMDDRDEPTPSPTESPDNSQVVCINTCPTPVN